MTYSIFTCCATITSCSKTFALILKEAVYPLSSHSPFPRPPQGLVSTDLLSVCKDLPLLDLSYKWDCRRRGVL